MVLAKTIYDVDGRILLNSGSLLKEKYRARLIEMDITEIYIEDSISQGIEVKSVVDQKLKMAGRSLAKKTFGSIKAKKDIPFNEVQDLVSELIDQVCFNTEDLMRFDDLRVNRDALYGHSFNVALISVVIGRFLGYDELELMKLGTGAFLHDIGKALLPDDIAGKNPLNESGKTFTAHTKLGYDLLSDIYEVSPLSKYIVLSHHERPDGLGYPNAINGVKLHQFAKIVSAANVFDILTNSTGVAKMPIYQAVEYLIAMSGTLFDKLVVDTFIRHLALFPNGSQVKLSSGEKGVVSGQNKNAPTRPIVKILSNSSARLENLMSNLSLVIVG
ncbi:HD-GYP domain-containing protein [Pelotomaculum propionicicum]|uniref:HD-GYP domain-containing protein n=1 Tax=Pelotomaculum propionicicum TaxID=258475 RepID=UPI003B81ECC7